MNVNLNKLKIGYTPYSSNFSQPGDQRRFCYYAAKRDINFEIAEPSGNYDIVIVTERGDISVWSAYKKGSTKVIYEFIDSYLAILRYDLKGIFRGLAKYVTGENRPLILNY